MVQRTPIDTPSSVSGVNNSNITETQIARGFDLVITDRILKLVQLLHLSEMMD